MADPFIDQLSDGAPLVSGDLLIIERGGTAEYKFAIPNSTVAAVLNAANSAGLRSAAGLGTIATQDANDVTISGGTISVSSVTSTGKVTAAGGFDAQFLLSGTNNCGIGNIGASTLAFFANGYSAAISVTAFGISRELLFSNANPGATDTSIKRMAAGRLSISDSSAVPTDDGVATLQVVGPAAVKSPNGAGLNVKTASQLLSAVSGATVTATNLIPAGAFLVGVSTRITTGLGTGGGTTGYQVGDGSDADRFGVAAATTAGTTTKNTDATADPTGWASAARSVVLTATGGNFNGTGAVRVSVAFIDNTAPTS
jgi:hypothetical protein